MKKTPWNRPQSTLQPKPVQSTQAPTEVTAPTLSEVMNAVLSSLMDSFDETLFTEVHRFRGAVLDEPITHYAKKVRFLLMLAICDMKLYLRLPFTDVQVLIGEMVNDYEINREAATATVKAIAKLQNIELPEETKPAETVDSTPETNWKPSTPFITQAAMQKLVQDPKPTPSPEPEPEEPTEVTKETVEEPPETSSPEPTPLQPAPTIPQETTPEPPGEQRQTKTVANLYQAHATDDKKTTQVPEHKPTAPPEPTKQVLKAPESASVPEQPATPPPPPPPVKTVPSHKVGELIYFGQHKWRILKINPDNTALILSDRLLSKMGYHNRKVGITWEGSDMRKYLNGPFLSKFTPAEQRQIRSIELENRFNEKYFTQGGLSTIDKVFLLSLGEVQAYIPKEADRMARHDGAPIWWWLRSPGMHPDHTAYVYASGSLSLDGQASVYTYENNGMHYVGYRVGGVRPAMVVSLETMTKA